MKEIYSAFIKAQAEIKGATKDSTNPHFHSKYADIESVIEAIKVPLANNNLAFIQPIFSENDKWFMNTILIHDTGQSIESGKVELIIKDKNNPQSLKSSVTYFRRTCLLSMCGIPDIDDDGNAGSNSKPKDPKPESPKQKEIQPQAPKNIEPQSQEIASLADRNQLLTRAEMIGVTKQDIKNIILNVFGIEDTTIVKKYQLDILHDLVKKCKNKDQFSKLIDNLEVKGPR